MRRTVLSALIVGVLFSSFLSDGASGETYWLQYRWSAHADKITGDRTWPPFQSMKGEKPEGVQLPEFKDSEPLFCKWESPMLDTGSIWIAVDKSIDGGLYNLLYIDSNQNGRLDDETPCKAFAVSSYEIRLGPAKVIFNTEDGPVTYHLIFLMYTYDNISLCAQSGCWYEGTINLDGKETQCMLVDYNDDGTFNDKGDSSGRCDRIRIGPSEQSELVYIGNLVKVGDTYYELEVARDGAFVKLNKAEDLQFAKLRVQPEITEVIAGGENGLFKLPCKEGLVEVPAGDYRLSEWVIERTDTGGKNWRMRGRSGNTSFKADADSETELDVGEPVISNLDFTAQGDRCLFFQRLAGRAGENIELQLNGSRPEAPSLRIEKPDGSYNKIFTFQYG
jgi:hypothetical protein